MRSSSWRIPTRTVGRTSARFLPDGLNIPTGRAALMATLHRRSVPNIWFFGDTDGDGVLRRAQDPLRPAGLGEGCAWHSSSFRLAGVAGSTRPMASATPATSRCGRRTSEGCASPAIPARALAELRQCLSLPAGWRRASSSRCRAGESLRHSRGMSTAISTSADATARRSISRLPAAVYPSFGKPDDGLGFAPVMMHHRIPPPASRGTHSSTKSIVGPRWR